MERYRFLDLVEKEQGFEFYQAFRDEIDWVIGGKGDTFWFIVMQDQAIKERKPKLIADAHPHFHYVYGFGDKALDVSEAYGVSIAYSDLKDLSAAFHLRYLATGEEVVIPE